MPLQQLCLANKQSSSSDSPFTPSPVHQGIYDVVHIPPKNLERCNSQSSKLSFSKDICRICHCEGDQEAVLIVPCYCTGSLRYVHQSCLQQWIKSSGTECCELCKFPFIMHSKVKPLKKWERLDMNSLERKKITFSVFFHLLVITCVIWSLYVLIVRTSQDVKNGEIEWPFWTKLMVVTIGFAGGIMFTYLQCKMYFQLCRRWRSYNRVICIQDAPDKIRLRADVDNNQIDSERKTLLSLSVISTAGNGTRSLSSTETGVSCSSNEGGEGLEGCVALNMPQTEQESKSKVPLFFSLNEIPGELSRPEETDSLIKEMILKEVDENASGFWLQKKNCPQSAIFTPPHISPSKSAPSLFNLPNSTAVSHDPSGN